MWMSVLLDQTVMIMPAVTTQRAPTPALASIHTLEMARTAQVNTSCEHLKVDTDIFLSF